VVGFAEAGEAGRVYNSAAALVPGRKPVVYRKAQLYGPYEREHFEPGPVSTAIVEVGGLKVGLLICYDVEFPEHVRRLAQAGCDLVAVPTALPGLPSSRTVAERVVPVRAFENQLFVAYADLAGHDGRFPYMGLSCIAAPDGTDLARAPADGDALLFATVDPTAYGESREANPYLTDLRLPAGS
jgi:predicted amidohydrolase